MKCKQDWLDISEIIDSLRIVPRLIVGIYLAILGWVTVYFSLMYFKLPPGERTVQLTAYCCTVLGAAYGALPFIVKIYMEGGRDWDASNRPAVVVAQQNNASAS